MRRLVGGLGAALLLMVLSIGHFAVAAPPPSPQQRQAPPPLQPLVVATKEAPPFVVFDINTGRPTGLTVLLVEHIGAALGRPVEWRRMSLPEMLKEVEAGKADMAAAAIAVTEDRERRMDFSSAYFNTGLGIAVRAEPTGVGTLLHTLLSSAFAQAVGYLAALIVLVGVVVWLFERRRHHTIFGGLRGLGNSIWWSAVTMSTVGYGDAVPRTLGGRAVATVWIFASLVLLSSFTASITTALTVSRLGNLVQGPADLPKVMVGSIAGTVGEAYGESRHLRRRTYVDLPAALHALADGEVQAVVHDAPQLQYAIEKMPELVVLDSLFEKQNFALALPLGSPLRKQVNQAMLAFLDTEQWQRQADFFLHGN